MVMHTLKPDYLLDISRIETQATINVLIQSLGIDLVHNVNDCCACVWPNDWIYLIHVIFFTTISPMASKIMNKRENGFI